MLNINKDQLINSLKEKTNHFIKDILWHYTFIVILLKSVIFLGVVISSSHSDIAFLKAYSTVPSFAIYSCFIIAILSFSYLFKGRYRLWFMVSINALISLLLMIDVWYYRAFGNFASVHLLTQMTNLDNLSDSIFSMMKTIDLVFIFDIVILLLIIIKTKNPYTKMNINAFIFALLFISSTGYISYAHYKIDVLNEEDGRYLFKICWTPNQTMEGLSPLGYHIYDAYTFWKDSQQLVLSDQENTEIKTWFEEKQENLPDNKYKSIFKGKNLIFIQVESLEGFIIEKKVNGQEISPNLNKLLKNSFYFDNFYEQVYNGTTSDAELMSNTSVYPVRRGSTFFRFPYNTYNSMPKIMQSLGYTTLAAHPDKGAYWNWMEALKSFGYEKCLDTFNFEQDEIIGLGLSDGSFLRQIESHIAKQKQPFFTYMITLTNHGPFNLPEENRELSLNEDLDKSKLGGYLQSVRYTDKHIGVLLSKLKEDGILDNTIVVIYGDHGGVHKFYQEELDEQSVPEEYKWMLKNDKRVPFIIYNPKLKGERLSIHGGEIDILPSISYLMGADEKTYNMTAMGRNLFKTNKDFVVLADRTYLGKSLNNKEKAHAIKGIDIADNIIQSDYFKKD